jgi:hypothetical protein
MAKSDPTLDRLAQKYLGRGARKKPELRTQPKKEIPSRKSPPKTMSPHDPKSLHDQPLADYGLTSYRYKGRYRWIMIGATDTNKALREASRSTGGECRVENLQIWDSTKYIDIPQEKERRETEHGSRLKHVPGFVWTEFEGKTVLAKDNSMTNYFAVNNGKGEYSIIYAKNPKEAAEGRGHIWWQNGIFFGPPVDPRQTALRFGR